MSATLVGKGFHALRLAQQAFVVQIGWPQKSAQTQTLAGKLIKEVISEGIGKLWKKLQEKKGRAGSISSEGGSCGRKADRRVQITRTRRTGRRKEDTSAKNSKP